MDVSGSVRSYLLSEHDALIDHLSTCADAVADGWDDDRTSDRDAVVTPLERTLEATGALELFPAVLTGAVQAAGYELRASPVAAPPYVAVTSRGPVLRATLDDGRLVVTFLLFDVERGEETTYVRGSDEPTEIVRVEWRSE